MDNQKERNYFLVSNGKSGSVNFMKRRCARHERGVLILSFLRREVSALAPMALHIHPAPYSPTTCHACFLFWYLPSPYHCSCSAAMWSAPWARHIHPAPSFPKILVLFQGWDWLRQCCWPGWMSMQTLFVAVHVLRLVEQLRPWGLGLRFSWLKEIDSTSWLLFDCSRYWLL